MSIEPPETTPEKPFPDPAFSAEDIKKQMEQKIAKAGQPAPAASSPMQGQLVVEKAPGISVETRFSVTPILSAVAIIVAVVVGDPPRRK